MRKIYEVIFQDEYNNLYLIGFFNKLDDALQDVNEMLSVYKDEDGNQIVLDKIEEYASTFNNCFDKDIFVEEGCIAVRGFILDADELEKEIKDGREKNVC